MKWKSPVSAILVCEEPACNAWFELSDSVAIQLHQAEHAPAQWEPLIEAFFPDPIAA
jgi:hypothetical protein